MKHLLLALILATPNAYLSAAPAQAGAWNLFEQQNLFTQPNLFTVEYVENAPWNRSELHNPPRYRGVGSVLVRAAVELSREHGFKGRIGLHSLPQANGFYANTCGMTDLGVDDTYQGLRYFEMTQAQTDAFVEKGAAP